MPAKRLIESIAQNVEVIKTKNIMCFVKLEFLKRNSIGFASFLLPL